MLFELRSSWNVYRTGLDLVALSGIVILLSILVLLFLFDDYIYISVTGIFLRISKITEIDLFGLVLPLMVFLLVMGIYTLVFVTLTIATREYRSEELSRNLFIKQILNSYPEVYKFLLVWFLIQFNITIFAYVLSIDTFYISVVFLIMNYVILFIPYAIVIEGVDFDTAIRKLLLFRRELALYPFMYAVVGIVFYIAILFLLDLLFPLEISRYVMLFINTFFLLPFMIILGANLYFNKFSLSIRKI
ncbi:MAG: hypothetical protein NZ908_00315 [Candidatus Micrarchaeota archaeon]|nr:hypothetical protein [Candidatus Micrarchaeota archaeon]MCX8154644.1 hypothetical protein [Candidatus Micrarchaeota archaeon]